MATFHSYELNGKKLSFANWISNISPEDVVFSSSTGKESIDQTKFTWQTDRLAKGADNAVGEGSVAGDFTGVATKEITNQTQILRKVVKVSDTANSTANYGRGRELEYQLEKAGKELKRDIEFALLVNKNQRVDSTTSTADQVRHTGGFRALVGETGANLEVNTLIVGTGAATHTGTAADPDTGAVVQTSANILATGAAAFDEAKQAAFEKALFAATSNLYIAGAEADTIMVHPLLAPAFSGMQEKADTRVRYFENVKESNFQVATITDPLGQTFKVVYNKFMPVEGDATAGFTTPIYIFSPSDWTQMVMRAPQRISLAKDGSAEKYMIECELGLRHRNPYASAVITATAA